jgi:signal transduction histidine kinase
VLGYAKLLLEDEPEDHPDRNAPPSDEVARLKKIRERDREAISLIADEAERMKKIIGGLLEYARAPRASEPATQVATGSVAPTSSEPSAVVRHVAALVAPQLRRAKATLTADVPAQRPVSIEAHALQQVLVNLVQNAAQAGATAITIKTRPAPGDIATVISVADNGPGVPAADRTRVFDPFFTTKAPGTGTGLGLAVCKHLVATAGGTIEVGDVADGHGAEFRVTIPVA